MQMKGEGWRNGKAEDVEGEGRVAGTSPWKGTGENRTENAVGGWNLGQATECLLFCYKGKGKRELGR